MISEARSHGMDVTTEAYPYTMGMTSIQSAIFDHKENEPDSYFASLLWPATAEHLTRDLFLRYRKQGGMIILPSNTLENIDAAIESPLTMIASDGHLLNGKGHPRTAGTYARVLGHYVREEKALDLMTALKKMTLMPAERLQKRAPAATRPLQHGSWPKRDREKAFTANRGAACRPPTRMKHRGFPRASAHCRAREKAVGTGPGKCYTVRRTVLASTYRERIRHFDFHCCRLGRHRWLSAGHAGSRFVFPEPLGEKHGRLLRLGPQRFLVVGGDFHGGDNVCRGHAASGHWPRLQKRHRRQLVLVERFAFGHDDRVSLCAVVAPLWAPDRRAVRGNALLGKARRILAGLSSALSRLADELR